MATGPRRQEAARELTAATGGQSRDKADRRERQGLGSNRSDPRPAPKGRCYGSSPSPRTTATTGSTTWLGAPRRPPWACRTCGCKVRGGSRPLLVIQLRIDPLSLVHHVSRQPPTPSTACSAASAQTTPSTTRAPVRTVPKSRRCLHTAADAPLLTSKSPRIPLLRPLSPVRCHASCCSLTSGRRSRQVSNDAGMPLTSGGTLAEV